MPLELKSYQPTGAPHFIYVVHPQCGHCLESFEQGVPEKLARLALPRPLVVINAAVSNALAQATGITAVPSLLYFDGDDIQEAPLGRYERFVVASA